MDGFFDALTPPEPGDYGQAYAYVKGLEAGALAEAELSVDFTLSDQDIFLLLDTDEWVDERDGSNNLRQVALTKTCLSEYSAQICAIGDRIASRVDTILLAAGVELSDDEYRELLRVLSERSALSSEALTASLSNPDTADTIVPRLDEGLQTAFEKLDENGIAERTSHPMELLVVDTVDPWLEEHGSWETFPTSMSSCSTATPAPWSTSESRWAVMASC